MKEFVRTILDYPVKGIQFRDITSLLQNADHFKQVVDSLFILKKYSFDLSISHQKPPYTIKYVY